MEFDVRQKDGTMQKEAHLPVVVGVQMLDDQFSEETNKASVRSDTKKPSLGS